MKNLFTILLLLFISISQTVFSFPGISFSELLIQSEQDPSLVLTARNQAMRQRLPVNILTVNGMLIDAKGIENGKVVYSVVNDFADPYNGGYTAFYEDVERIYDRSNSRIDYGNGNIVDNTGGLYDPVISSIARGEQKFLMIPDWTFDRVWLFSLENGDLVDTAIVHHSNPQLQSPKHALPAFNGRQIIVSDQISDLVQRFDTAGSYVGFYAPAGGVNNSILDNIRGIRYRPNNNLLVTVGSGTSQNTIQQFDTGGVSIGAFISSNLNSPFDILLRQNDILVSNFAGSNRISRFDNSGTFIDYFYTGSDFSLTQQLHRLPNGRILAASFSAPSGVAVLDSNGVFIRLMTGVTGARGVYLLESGKYLVTNGTGVHEVDSASGNLIRTIVNGTNFQFISLYDPDMVVSINNNVTVTDYQLYSNYPNPFNPMTTITYSIPSNIKNQMPNVKIIVYNNLGKEVTSLVNENKPAGNYEVIFNGEGLSSGVYFYSLYIDGGFVDSKRMVLIK